MLHYFLVLILLFVTLAAHCIYIDISKYHVDMPYYSSVKFSKLMKLFDNFSFFLVLNK